MTYREAAKSIEATQPISFTKNKPKEIIYRD